jgi:hypothetical protein
MGSNRPSWLGKRDPPEAQQKELLSFACQAGVRATTRTPPLKSNPPDPPSKSATKLSVAIPPITLTLQWRVETLSLGRIIQPQRVRLGLLRVEP